MCVCVFASCTWHQWLLVLLLYSSIITESILSRRETFLMILKRKFYLPVEVMLALTMGLKSLFHLVLFHLEPLSVLKYTT